MGALSPQPQLCELLMSIRRWCTLRHRRDGLPSTRACLRIRVVALRIRTIVPTSRYRRAARVIVGRYGIAGRVVVVAGVVAGAAVVVTEIGPSADKDAAVPAAIVVPAATAMPTAATTVPATAATTVPAATAAVPAS